MKTRNSKKLNRPKQALYAVQWKKMKQENEKMRDSPKQALYVVHWKYKIEASFLGEGHFLDLKIMSSESKGEGGHLRRIFHEPIVKIKIRTRNEGRWAKLGPIVIQILGDGKSENSSLRRPFHKALNRSNMSQVIKNYSLLHGMQYRKTSQLQSTVLFSH